MTTMKAYERRQVSGLDISDNNMFHNLYISETYILYKL